MPFVRVSLPAGRTKEQRWTLGDQIYEAMRESIHIPENDKFIVLNEYDEGMIFLDPAYMGIERSQSAMVIEITLRKGRTDVLKQALYASIAERLQQKLGIRKEDVMVVLRENDAADWSFGNGVGQYITG